MITKKDKHYLKRCIQLAQNALDNNDQPFGSVLVSASDEILFEDHNHVSGGDHTQHPEFAIAKWAANNLTPEERKKATVYTSGEHCPMCAAAHGWVGLGRIVYASSAKQLFTWTQEINAPLSPIYPLPIQEVIRNCEVDGPDPELAQEVQQLIIEYYAKN